MAATKRPKFFRNSMLRSDVSVRDIKPSRVVVKVSVSSLFAKFVAIVYPFSMIIYTFTGGALLQILFALAGVSVFFIMFFKNTCVSEQKKLTMVLIAFSLMVCGWYGALWTGMRSYGVVLVLLSCLGVTWAALEFRLSRYVYEYPFYVFLGVTGWLIAAGTDQHEFNAILAAGSRNVYSAVLLALAMGYLFSKKINGEKPSVTLGLALVVASFFLYSRTGLVLGFGLLFLFLWENGLVIKFRFLLLGCCPALLLFAVFFDFSGFFTNNSNFEKGLDSPRFAIWASYFLNMDVFNIFFGYDMNDNELIKAFGGNPHSAYVRLHSYFGLGVFVLLFFSYLSIYKLAKEHRWLLTVLVSFFYFRAAFDPVYFIWVFDYIFYPFVFFIFFEKYFSKSV